MTDRAESEHKPSMFLRLSRRLADELAIYSALEAAIVSSTRHNDDARLERMAREWVASARRINDARGALERHILANPAAGAPSAEELRADA